MIQSNESFSYEKWCGATSDGGGCRPMVVRASTKAGFGACTKGGLGFSTKAGFGTKPAGPFDDERFAVWDARYRNLDISRWDTLTSAGAKLRVVQEKSGDGSIVYQVYAGEDDSDSDETARRATAELLELSSRKRLTKWDVDEFQRLVTKARQEFELIGILKRPDFLQPDDSLESVIERLPAELITSIGYDRVKDFVEDDIRLLNGWEKTRLFYDYQSFLPECGWITTKMETSLCLKRLQEDVTFSERRFDMIPFQRIMFEFMRYICHLGMYEGRGMVEEGKTAYKKHAHEGLNLERLSLEKRRKRFPPQFVEPIHFLVFREREKQYIIQDPVVEVTKIQAFFHDFPLDEAETEEGRLEDELGAEEASFAYDQAIPFEPAEETTEIEPEV